AHEAVPVTAPVDESERRPGGDRDAPLSVGEEHADGTAAFAAERRPGVVVVEDLTVAPAVQREPLGAPLGHADPMSPPVPGNDEGRAESGVRNAEEHDRDDPDTPHGK